MVEFYPPWLSRGQRLSRALLRRRTAALDLLARVAGQEPTPHAAPRNGSEAAALKAMLVVTLDILAINKSKAS